MKQLTILTLLVCCGAWADPGLDQLRQSFSGLLQSSTLQLDAAAKMKPMPVGLGGNITKADCVAWEGKISAGYKVDPFHFVFEGGASETAMCGGRQGWRGNHLLNQTGVSNQGLPYTRIIQLEGDDQGGDLVDVANFFIDSANHIVEVQGLTTSHQSGEVIRFGITSIDKVGNLYIAVYEKAVTIAGGLAQNVSGVHHMEQYLPADGSAPWAYLRNTVENVNDPTQDYQVMAVTRTDRRDWQNYENSITHEQGYYVYGGKYYSNFDKPNFMSSLTIKKRGGQEFCAYGDVKTDQAWVYYPADSVAYQNCGNY